MYVFAGSSSGMLYAFDSGNNWVVVEISAEVNGLKCCRRIFPVSYWISLCMLKVWSIGVRTTKSRKELQENPGEKNGSGDKFAAESKVHCFGRNKTVSFFKVLVIVKGGVI
jgi:hypothetical protein